MPHISRHNLAQKTYDEIMRALLVALSRCNDTSVQRHFTDSFLTKTERTMLAKRLAIIAMVRQGIAPHHIAQVLKVSPSTVARFTLVAEDRTFAFISPIRKKEKSVQDILDLVEKILQAGLPPKVGKGRWKRYFEA